MQLTKWVHGPIWISKVKVIHWPWSKVTQIQHFQTSFPEKPPCWLKPNFMWSLNGIGERKFVQVVQVTWPRWPPCPYMVKTWKSLLLCNQRPMTLKVCMQHQVLKYYWICQMMTMGWPWPILRQVKFGPLCFCMGKSYNNGFFRNYCSLWYKSWYMQSTKWVHEALWVPKVKIIDWPWSKSLRFNIFKLLFLNNH